MEELSRNRCFGGEQRRYQHQSKTLGCEMTFSIFLPYQIVTAGIEKAAAIKLPSLYWLSGLTCNDENFVQKANAQRVASELGIILIAADTSPRGKDVADAEDGAYDLGLGAGFYLNATQAPWAQQYRMYDYISEELPALIEAEFPVDAERQSIFGHSMGGHGALSIALKNPEKFRSVSAFAPIVSPINCPWGHKALTNYLGEDQNTWEAYDTVSLIKKSTKQIPMLIDQGSEDQFLLEQLKPELLINACNESGYALQYNLRTGYDHSYFFIASFIEEHLLFHAKHLK